MLATPKPDPVERAKSAIAKLDARLTDLRAEHDALAERRAELVVRSTDAEDPDLLLEIEALGQAMAKIDLQRAAIDDTKGRLGAVKQAVANEAANAETASAMKRTAANAKAARAALIALDDEGDAYAERYHEARVAIARLYSEADGAMRASVEFELLAQTLIPQLPGMMLSRLAFREQEIMVPGISTLIDREGPVPSARDRFEAVLSPLSPPPGRPTKEKEPA